MGAGGGFAAIVVIAVSLTSGSLAATGTPATGPLVSARSVGTLRMRQATRSTVRRSYGRRSQVGSNSLDYACARGGCRVNFFFAGARDRLAGRLVGAVLGAGSGHHYRTASGVRLDMSVRRARMLDPALRVAHLCGFEALRSSRRAGLARAFAGLTMLGQNRKIVGFVVVDPGERVRCVGGGFSFG